MKLGYTLWNDYHFTNYPEILANLREIGVEIIVIVPQYLLDRDDRARLVGVYLPIKNLVNEVKQSGFELMIKPHFIPRESNGKQPPNWQGWVGTVDMNSWGLLMGRIKLELESLTRDYRPRYFCIGSDLVGTHAQREEWAKIIDAMTGFEVSLVYASNFSQPLIKRFRWALFWSSLLGRHNRTLDLVFQSERFEIPDVQRAQVARSIYRSGFRFPLDAVGLNLYWPPEDKKYEDLSEKWFQYERSGFEINYVESVEMWRGTNPLWITECDLIGQHRSDLDYYQKWWETCLDVWGNMCEVLICKEDETPQWIETARQSALIKSKIAEWRQKKDQIEDLPPSLTAYRSHRTNQEQENLDLKQSSFSFREEDN